MPDHCVHLTCLASLEHALALTALGTTVPCFCGPPLNDSSPCASILLRQQRGPSQFDLCTECLVFCPRCAIMASVLLLALSCFRCFLGLVALRASHQLLCWEIITLLTSTAALLTLLFCTHTHTRSLAA